MLIRIPNWLGDTLMATPVYENLKDQEELIFYGPPHFLSLLEDFPNTRTLPFYQGDHQLNLQNLRKFKEQKGLLLTNSFSSAWLFFKAGLKERLGYATDLRGLLLTKKVTPPKKRMHQRDKYLYLIEKLGYPIKTRDLRLYLKEEKLVKARFFLQAFLDLKHESFIVLAPGASYGPAKRWPELYFKRLAEKFNKEGFKVLIVGSLAEVKLGSLIAEGLSTTYNLCGKTDLSLLAGILHHTSLLVSNDSGLMHLGAALRIPQLAIFGSTDPELTGPLNPKAKVLKLDLVCSPCFCRECPRGDYKCLVEIKPETVFEEAIKLIN